MDFKKMSSHIQQMMYNTIRLLSLIQAIQKLRENKRRRAKMNDLN